MKVAKTYEVWDDEALEIGETNERGFEFEDETMTPDEFLREISWPHVQSSQSSFTLEALSHGRVWFSSVDSDVDFETGERVNYSWHLKELTEKEARKLYRVMCARAR